MTGQEIVDAVIEEGGFDTSSTGISRATVSGWVADRYKSLVVRSKWRKAIQTIGTTTAQEADYPLDGSVVDLEELRVNGLRYTGVGVEEMWDLDACLLLLKPGYTGVFAPTYDAAGATSIRLYPVPTTSGAAIEALVVLPPVEFADSAGFTPDVPDDLHRKLVRGAIAEGLAVIDERLTDAAVYEQEWEGVVASLAGRKVRRVQQPVTSLRVSRRPR